MKLEAPPILSRPSIHHSSRNGAPILAIVNHTMEGTLEGTASWFRNPASRVSAHYGVGKGGELHQYVAPNRAAWHAGTVRSPTIILPYPEDISPNLYTIGIEWEGRSGDVPTDRQYETGLALHRWLLSAVVEPRLPLRQRVIGHYQINSVDRPHCPGAGFPWERLYSDLAAFEVGQPQVIQIRLNGHLVSTGQLINKQAWGPVRDLAMAMSADNVDWDEATMTVNISKDTELLQKTLHQAELVVNLLKGVLNQ